MCLIDSDLGVFTEMMEHLGVKGLQFAEVYSLTEEDLQEFHPYHGLYKWAQDDKPQGAFVNDSRLEEIFFPGSIAGIAFHFQFSL